MRLPSDDKVNVGKLNAVFNSTSASYKFYWFLALIESIESGKEVITKRELFARMIANAWYTVNYFQVSFGKQDKIQSAIEFLKSHENIDVNEKKNVIIDNLMNSSSKETMRQLQHFDANVPCKFLSPWLGTGKKSEMYLLSQENYNFPPYALYTDSILVQPDWLDYFKRNSGMLKDFCYWNLTLFLQSRNPNVPDIPNKLKRPENRGSLSKHKVDFWDIVIKELGHVNCIYTGNELVKGTYAVEHFIPFQFVAHDLMWNLIPADPSFNSSKGAKLPQMENYFNDFYELQKEAVAIVRVNKPKNHFLEEYLTVFPDLNISKDRYAECIQPMLTIAHNNGFEYMK
ncbi:MAG: hypothetical protein ACI865_003349 [Flavobacteriaceae bacterium]|jgi:hypothetical protein